MEIKAIHDVVAEQITGLSTTLNDNLVATLVKRELDKMDAAVVKGFDRLETMEKAFKRFRPDQVSFNLDGSVASEQWSKDKLAERNKAAEEIEKLTAAIEKALSAPVALANFDKLIELNNKANSSNNKD